MKNGFGRKPDTETQFPPLPTSSPKLEFSQLGRGEQRGRGVWTLMGPGGALCLALPCRLTFREGKG